MKLKSEAILFSGKDEENKDPSNTPSIVHLYFSPFDASCFRFHLLVVSCLWSRVSQSVTRADGKGWYPTFWYDSPQPDFLLFSKPIVHLYTKILSTLSRLFRKSDLFQQPISQLSSKLCVFLTWSHHCSPPNLFQSHYPATLTSSYLSSENLTSTSVSLLGFELQGPCLVLSWIFYPQVLSLLKDFNPVK